LFSSISGTHSKKLDSQDRNTGEARKLMKCIEQLDKERKTIPSGYTQDPGYRRVNYLRYADDCAPRTLTERRSDAA
jgi:hypothetical protein